MNDDDLKSLRQLDVPLPSAEARRRAIGASLMAFDKTEPEKKSSPATQGSVWTQRLKSIVPTLKGFWTMDTRRYVPAGTAVLALLILAPLGYQLYSTTALSPLQQSAGKPITVIGVPPHIGTPQAPVNATARRDQLDTLAKATALPAPIATDASKDASVANAPTTTPSQSGVIAEQMPEPAMKPAAPAQHMERLANMAASSAGRPAAPPAGTAVPEETEADLDVAPAAAAPEGAVATDAMVAPSPAMSMSARAATTPTGDKFQQFTESAQKAVSTDPVSTFSIDVDTASYSYVRRSLNEGRIPEPDAVRLEEMINYFPYDYPAATSADVPFKPTISVFPTPWNAHTELMQIGIKGYVPPVTARKPANLVFLVDTSGSMDEPDKLPLLQRSLGLLVNTLSAEDTVSIVAYAGSAGVVLEPTYVSEKSKILAALDNLEAGGSTAGAEGIELAYQLAAEHKIANGNNRVILATDGDFNVGISDPDQLKGFIKAKRASGIALSVLGFGEGNLDDATMQALAQNGDGNASYIDSLSEAQKVLVKEAGSTLDTIAKDVKIQVEFNPATVSSYRLIGYETRALNREDFNNDKVDAGDVGEGHTVTALYEITPAGADTPPPVDALRYGSQSAAAASGIEAGKSAELADVKLRYKLPGNDTSKLLEQPVTPAMVVTDIGKASDDARWAAAVAAFGQKLKGSDYAGTMSYGAIRSLATGARGSDPDGYRSEFINLVGLADGLTGGGTPLPQPRPDDAPQAPIVN